MNQKSLFETFPKMEDAQDLITLLTAQEIEFKIIDNAFDADITFTSNRASSIQVFIDSTEFERAHKLIEARAEQQVNLLDKTHYLHKFSTQELYQVLKEKDKWSSYDYAFAKSLLKERGEDVSIDNLKSIQEERNKELDTPEKSSRIQLAFGYFSSLLGGILGILIGWYLWKSKRTSTNGERIAVYTESDRKHGKYIAIIGIIVLSIYLTISISFFFYEMV